MFTTTITHIVAIPENISDENCSFFQRYSDEVLNDYLWVFEVLSTVPHDVMEPYLNSSSYLNSRLVGSSLNVQMLRADLLQDVYGDYDNVFNIIWSTPKTYHQAKKVESVFKFKPLHITSFETKEAEFIGNLNHETLNQKISEHIEDTIKKLDKNKEVDNLLSIISSRENKDSIKLGFNPLGHNCTRPLYRALSGYEYYADKFEDNIPSDNIEQHVSGMLKLAEVITETRKKSETPYYLSKSDVIIYSMSMCSFLYKQNSHIWNELYRKLDKPKREFLKSAIIRNKMYSNFTLTGAEAFNPYEDPIISGLLKERQSELAMFTSVVSILAANHFSPALRLPNAVMLHHDLLKNISSLIRNPNKKTHKNLNLKLSNYSETLKSEISEKLLDACFLEKNKVLALCDFPIEWININGFPIMFTHEISRIPTTPGNLCSQLALSGQRIILPFEEFKDILIITSFKSTDPIKNHLKIGLDVFKSKDLYKNINLVEVNVNSEAELINALNDFSGGIVVFDCHGSHGGEHENGWLCIGDDKVDTWSLAHKANIPPIVILSACSTHPIDGSHASVANGLFRCGAISVIGTYAPIQADHAGIFISRLLYRISEFIPIIISSRPISWREVISGFFKMSYSTDVLRYMMTELKILNAKQYKEVHNDANYIINAEHPNWTEKFLSLISDKTGIEKDEIRKIIKDNFHFVDTMLYSQLGRPENIIISE